MKVSAVITLKKDVLDPQGKVIHETLDGMGFNPSMKLDKENILKLMLKKMIQKKLKILWKICVKNF